MPQIIRHLCKTSIISLRTCDLNIYIPPPNPGQLQVTLGAASRLKLALHTAREVYKVNNRATEDALYQSTSSNASVEGDILRQGQREEESEHESQHERQQEREREVTSPRIVCEVAAYLAPQVKVVSANEEVRCGRVTLTR